ncbi:08d9259b-1c3d-4375-afcf-55f1db1a8f41-CDS [Sclerotinia trifoliorum]|uniref:deoxyribose-phosphate aldolase n=1 Tax=Sclerotinia trifoliorum TaxID=28548 RepID=A0A8H2VTH3_9HELO|nr:08d9259b-1c3d-4375-afcf-55f1db1a8f41-CDS [Sclerotinia trifoliorum]
MASSNAFSPTLAVSLPILAKMIDHSLLHPTMTDAEISIGLSIAAKYKVATACVKPYSIEQAVSALKDTGVEVCPVIGFPAGNNTTEVKVFEASKAVEAGGKEIDMVINIGKALGGDWDYVQKEIQAVNDAVVSKGSILKVIFENDYLTDLEIVKLCHICSDVGVAFVKTSTGYGFVKQSNGMYSYQGATLPHLDLMRKSVKAGVQIKAAGGVRTLDDLLRVRALGVTRVGATATEAILEEAVRRGIGEELVVVFVLPLKST